MNILNRVGGAIGGAAFVIVLTTHLAAGPDAAFRTTFRWFGGRSGRWAGPRGVADRRAAPHACVGPLLSGARGAQGSRSTVSSGRAVISSPGRRISMTGMDEIAARKRRGSARV